MPKMKGVLVRICLLNLTPISQFQHSPADSTKNIKIYGFRLMRFDRRPINQVILVSLNHPGYEDWERYNLEIDPKKLIGIAN